jgi:hypothetical protein
MTKEEFEQLRAEQEAEAKGGKGEGSGGAGGSGDQGGGIAPPRRPRLSLGRDLLQGDFGEMVGSTILQVRGALKAGRERQEGRWQGRLSRSVVAAADATGRTGRAALLPT